MANETDPSPKWTTTYPVLDDILSTTTTQILDEKFTNITDPTILPFRLREDSWVIPLVVLSTINITAIVFFEIYVLYKSCGSRRHLFLGQVLLFGLFLCSLLGFAFVPTPQWFTCAITRAGVGIAYVTVFATLLVKCVFLLSLHVGVYMSAAVQGLILFFAIAVQIAISVQWLVYRPPEIIPLIIDKDFTEPEVCSTDPLERIKYLGYAMLLLFLVMVSAVRTRALKENNKEALFISLAVAFIIASWVAWTAVVLIFDRRYEDAAEGFGLVCTATVVFLLVFMPKAIQLSSGSVDRRNGSTTGSHSVVYTPSFLHLQPHAVLPGSMDGTIVKQATTGVDICRGYPSRFLRYDCPSFHQMEPPVASGASSQQKSNVTFAHSPLY